jgi:hypothetical protein
MRFPVKLTLLLLCVASMAPSAFAADSRFERILLPITIAETPGAFGSRWASDIWYRSDADAPVQVFPLIVSDGFPGPHVTEPLQVALFGPGRPPGQFIYVTRELADQVHVSLRIFDTSRDALTWGTELPVVREAAFTQKPITFLNVPSDARFRVMLRVYESDLRGLGRARIDVFDQASDALVGSQTVDLPTLEPIDYNPGYAQLSLTDLIANRPPAAYRVVVSPASARANLWAFVTVTNNQTQQVTTICPR